MVSEVVPITGAGRTRQQLPDEVASYVREMIMSGEVRPGEFLRMEPIAEAVGVSNTPVREGLLALSSEGLVELVPRRGFAVAPFSRQDVRDIFWAQAKLAGELAARAAKKLTPAQIAGLEQNVQLYTAALKAGDEAGIANYGYRFHREINLAAESHRLARLLGSVANSLPDRFYATIEGRAAESGDEHPVLLAALRKGDARQARAIMEKHILGGADHLIALLEERGLWSDRDGAASAS